MRLPAARQGEICLADGTGFSAAPMTRHRALQKPSAKRKGLGVAWREPLQCAAHRCGHEPGVVARALRRPVGVAWFGAVNWVSIDPPSAAGSGGFVAGALRSAPCKACLPAWSRASPKCGRRPARPRLPA